MRGCWREGPTEEEEEASGIRYYMCVLEEEDYSQMVKDREKNDKKPIELCRRRSVLLSY